MTLKRLLILGLLVLALPVGLMLFGPGSEEEARSETPRPAPTPTVVTTINGERVLTDAPAAPATRPSELPVDELRLSDVSYITAQGDTPVLVLTDGGRVRVTPSVRSELPNDVALRATYERDR